MVKTIAPLFLLVMVASPAACAVEDSDRPISQWINVI